MSSHRLPNVLVPLLAPELLEPLLALAADPAAGEMHEQVAVAVAHVVAALGVGVEFALGVDADVVADELVLEHQVLDGVLLGAAVVLAHEHGVVGHHLEGPAGKGTAAEEGAAGVDALVVLGDEDVNVLDAEVAGRVDMRGVLFQLAVEDRRVPHQAGSERGGRQDFLREVVVGRHDDDVGVDQPDPFGAGVAVEGFSDGGDLGPCLWGVSVGGVQVLWGAYAVSFANVVAASVEPQVLVAVLCAVLLAVLEHTREDIGDSAVVAAAVAGGQHDDVAVLGGARIAVEAARVLGHLPVPLGLGLEVAGLRRVVVRLDGGDGLAGGIVAVVLDGHVAEEVEEHDEDGDGGDGEDNGPGRIISICTM